MSIVNENNINDIFKFDDIDWENTPLVYKPHALRLGHYLPRYETHVFVDYYILHLLRVPRNEEAIRYIEDHPEEWPMIRRLEDGTVTTYAPQTIDEALNQAKNTGARYLLLVPLKLEAKRYRSVSLDDITKFEQDIF
jgi:hypothetical protein